MPDSRDKRRKRIDETNELNEAFRAQFDKWNERFEYLSKWGFYPSISGPFAFLTLIVFGISIGYLPQLLAITTGGPLAPNAGMRGGIAYDDPGRPKAIGNLKLADLARHWGHRCGFLQDTTGFDLSQCGFWDHWTHHPRRSDPYTSELKTVIADVPMRCFDISAANVQMCYRPGGDVECACLNSTGHRDQQWWDNEPVGVPAHQPLNVERVRASGRPARSASPRNVKPFK